MKRSSLWISVPALLAAGSLLAASCDSGVGGGDNPCAEGEQLPPVECGVGMCHVLVDACSANGQPVECTPGEPQDADTCGDGLDNDCDGNVDEYDDAQCACDAAVVAAKPCFVGTPFTRNVGLCRDGTQSCANGVWGECGDSQGPAGEIANGLDDDCDGLIDEDLECESGAEQYCYGSRAETADTGPCKKGVQSCDGGQWGKCLGQILPTWDDCDGVDSDCNGVVDDASPCP